MKLLVLGGTVFAGRAFAELALGAGHDVTIFHRGQHRAAELDGRVTVRHGDRDGRLEALGSGLWDTVVDFSGYRPGIVEQSAALLAPRVGRYVFVSTVSVYSDFTGARDEDAPRLADDSYGGLKAGCEDVVRRHFPAASLAGGPGERATIVRPGLIVGPNDASDRYTYWVRRFERGGEILAPGDGNRLVQVVDVRDLAAFCLKLAEADRPGTFNVKGEPSRIADVLASIQAVTPRAATVKWLPEAYLLDGGAEQWTELPMWIAGKDQNDPCERAKAAGLTLRPLEETAAATRAWDLSRDQALPLKAGLAPEKERALLSGYRPD